MLGKDRQTTNGKDVVDANRTEEGAFTCHIGACDDVIVAVTNLEVITHSLLAEERMVKTLGRIDHGIGLDNLRIRARWFVVTERGHRHECVEMAHCLYPVFNAGHILLLPFKEAAHNEVIGQIERIRYGHPHFGALVEVVQDVLQLSERLGSTLTIA